MTIAAPTAPTLTAPTSVNPDVLPPVGPPPGEQSPPPGQEPANSESPLFLVVIADHAEVERLSMPASLVALSSGRLLVAIASPRTGFSTDAAVLWRAAMGRPDDIERLATAVDRQLADTSTGYEIVELPYRDSPSAARRARRIAAASDRLARRRRAMYLRDWFPEISLVERRTVSS